MARRKLDQRDFPPGEVLLVRDVTVGRDHRVEPRRFRRGQQVAVGQRFPPHLAGGFDVMAGEQAPHAARHVGIKQKPGHEVSRRG